MLGRAFCKRVNKMYGAKMATPIQHLLIDYEKFSFRVMNDRGEPLFYYPSATALAFHQSDELVRAIIGPYGSGKTTAMLADILFRSCRMPPAPNGVRYSRWAIVRNTYGELESTTYQSWIAWFENLGVMHRNKKPNLVVRHQFNDGAGDLELEILFLALDNDADIRKLKSLEVCGVYINEASEIEKAVFDHSKTRIGRYRLNMLKNYWKGVILDTNPPNDKHWIYRIFEDEKVEQHKIFHQPEGLIKDENDKWKDNPDADNKKHLDKNYYLNMTYGVTQEFINVYCLGHYGTVLSGKKIYPEYNDDMHSVESLLIDDALPLYIGMDFGLTPAAVFVQETKFGTFNIVHELTSESLGIKQFVENVFTPFLSRHCANIPLAAIVGDPAGEKKNENDLTSCFDILHEAGYMIEGAKSNLITPRLESVRASLAALVEGKPKLTVSRRTCPTLREGFLGAYHYKKLKVLGSEVYDNKPLKNEFSHIHDALQYILLYLTTQAKQNLNNSQNEYSPRLMRF